MARISSYAVDSGIVTTDKVLGTDSQGLTTKNFSFSAVKDWLNSSAVVGVVGQNTYTFQTIPGNPVVRDSGSISLPGLGGDGTAFADITSMVFSERAVDNSVATNYINTLIGKQVVLMQLDNLDNFGIYNLDSFTPLQGSPGFYTAALSVDYSHGNLISDQNYGFAVYGLQSAGATWGSIQGTVTNQTDLVNYIADEIAAIPTPATPTLQSVTDEGNTTTNSIGIGTSSPSYPLHVVGNSLVTGTQFIGDTFTRIQQGSGNLILSNLSSNGSVVLRTNSVEQMRLTSAGRVGIGTTNPISKLELQDGTFTVDNGNIDVFFGGISITRNSANNTALKVNQRGTADIFALQDDGTDVLTVIDGGNVGIGTTAPGSTLPSDAESGSKILQLTGVSGSSGDTAILLRSSDNSSGFDLWHNASSGDSYIDNRYFYGDTIFRVRTASTPNEVVRITPDGNVGIGTTAPAAKLDVDGSIYPTRPNGGTLGLLQFKEWSYVATPRITGNNNRMELLLSGETVVLKDHNTIGDGIQIKNRNNVVAQFGDANGSGNVGIGTTAPSEKLEVVGKMVLKDAGGSVYIGELAGTNDNAVGRYNVGIGDYALNSNTSGYNNVAIGSSAMYNSTSGFRNVALGVFALGDNVSGHGNTAIGYSANTLSTEGYMNVAVGYEALENATTAYWNTAVGAGALQNSDAPASDNTAVGFYAMNQLTTGRYNTSLGTYALSDTELGSDNTAVGYYAGGGDYQGTQSVYLGMNTSPNSWNETNQIVIGYGASGNGSNSVTLGNASITKTILKGNVGIGTTAPSTLLHLRGDSPTLRIEADGANESSIIELVQDGGVTGAAIKYNGASNIEALQFNTGVSDTRMTIKRATGNVGIGTTAPSSKAHINGTAMEQLRMETQGGPVNAADAKGSIGDMAYDADFFYIKTSNGWGRVPLDFGF